MARRARGQRPRAARDEEKPTRSRRPWVDPEGVWVSGRRSRGPSGRKYVSRAARGAPSSPPARAGCRAEPVPRSGGCASGEATRSSTAPEGRGRDVDGGGEDGAQRAGSGAATPPRAPCGPARPLGSRRLGRPARPRGSGSGWAASRPRAPTRPSPSAYRGETSFSPLPDRARRALNRGSRIKPSRPGRSPTPALRYLLFSLEASTARVPLPPALRAGRGRTPAWPVPRRGSPYPRRPAGSFPRRGRGPRKRGLPRGELGVGKREPARGPNPRTPQAARRAGEGAPNPPRRGPRPKSTPVLEARRLGAEERGAWARRARGVVVSGLGRGRGRPCVPQKKTRPTAGRGR